jgi:hypothetical protein
VNGKPFTIIGVGEEVIQASGSSLRRVWLPIAMQHDIPMRRTQRVRLEPQQAWIRR